MFLDCQMHQKRSSVYDIKHKQSELREKCQKKFSFTHFLPEIRNTEKLPLKIAVNERTLSRSLGILVLFESRGHKEANKG